MESKYSEPQAETPPPGDGRHDPVQQRDRSALTGRAFRSDLGVTPLSRAEPQRQARRHHLASLVFLVCVMAALRWGLPPVVEELRYGWQRGQLRAEYETAGEGLAQVGLQDISQAYQMVCQRVGPSVVHIEVVRPVDSGLLRTLRHTDSSAYAMPGDQGSGVIIDHAGHILTNAHVVANGSEIKVGLPDGRRVDARLIGNDPLTDLAVLKVDTDRLQPIAWGDSDEIGVGSPVWAIGSPFGLDQTVTFGILSGKNRAAKAGRPYQDFMQSDVAVNPGNSGGPLVDAQGRLVGINTAIIGDKYSGVSFSIPSNVARVVYDRLVGYGSMRRGWLGVELADITDQETGQLETGALVKRILGPDQPAAVAGIRDGDRIVGFNGHQVRGMRHLMRMVGDAGEGAIASMEVVRGEENVVLDVRLGNRDDS